MPAKLSADIIRLIDGRNFAHLATLMSDGSPQSVPVWIGREAEHLVICTGEGSLKAKNTRRDSCLPLHHRFPRSCKEAQLGGRVVERRPDTDFKYMAPHLAEVHGQAIPVSQPRGKSGTRDRDRKGTIYQATF